MIGGSAETLNSIGIFHIGEHYDRSNLHELDSLEFFGIFEVMEKGSIVDRLLETH